MDASTPAGTSDIPEPQALQRRARRTRPVMTVRPSAAGDFLSYLFRSANGPVAGKLIGTFGLGPRDLALLTAIVLLIAASFQVLAGLLIGQFGPRRAWTTLLVVAAGGVVLFAVAPAWPLSASVIGAASLGTLAAARRRPGTGTTARFVTASLAVLIALAPMIASARALT